MIAILPMTPDDVPQVTEIDRLSFPLPWSATSYRHELLENKHAYFFVAIDGKRRAWHLWLGRWAERRVVGFVGYWCIADEAHISTIAVHPRWRGKGIGEELLRAALINAIKQGASEAMLEVRASNRVAQSLYRKHGFEEVSRRKNYYRDNGEDAVLMAMKPLRVAINGADR